MKTIRELAKENPMMHSFDFKWRDSQSFRELPSVLEDLGYQIKNEEDRESIGEYNDLKAYYDIQIEVI